ncbi:MAG: hypothetical protein ACTSWY_16165 [Promethearchaeota archaeon]
MPNGGKRRTRKELKKIWEGKKLVGGGREKIEVRENFYNELESMVKFLLRF